MAPVVHYVDVRDVTNRLARVHITDVDTVDGLLDVLDPDLVRQISDQDLALLAGAPPAVPFTLTPSPLLLPDLGLLVGHGSTPAPPPPLPALYPATSLDPRTTLYPASGS